MKPILGNWIQIGDADPVFVDNQPFGTDAMTTADQVARENPGVLIRVLHLHERMTSIHTPDEVDGS